MQPAPDCALKNGARFLAHLACLIPHGLATSFGPVRISELCFEERSPFRPRHCRAFQEGSLALKNTSSNVQVTPALFMWAGGKGRMFRHYANLLPQDVFRRPYVEPFAGGAAFFNHLSSRGQVAAILSDIKTDLMDIYRLVRSDPEFLIEENRVIEEKWMSLDIPTRKAFYYQLREEYWSMPPGSVATARLYFLLRTCFNGIWQTCKASGGRFGTPVGLAAQKIRVLDPDVIKAWSRKLSLTDIVDGPYDQIQVPPGAFVFCDPPYRDSFTSYGGAFDDDAQAALVDWCRRTHRDSGATVWLSNRDTRDGFFECQAPEASFRRFPITYTAGRRKRTENGYVAKPATELLLVWE